MAGRDTITSGVGNEIDLRECDREPIHFPGSIQPQGFLLVLDTETTKILQSSDNTTDFLGMPAEALLGKSLDEALGAQAATESMRRYATLTDRNAATYLATIRV